VANLAKLQRKTRTPNIKKDGNGKKENFNRSQKQKGPTAKGEQDRKNEPS